MKFLPSLTRERRPAPRPSVTQTSPLLKDLPVDLIIYLVKFLPPESVVLLSLTCTPLYNIIGTSLLESLKADDRARYKFLAVLDHEWPGHVACWHCAKLHAIEKASRYGYYHPRTYLSERLKERIGERGWLPRSPCGMQDHDWNSTYPHFSSIIFRMAMKLYRQKLKQDCGKLLQQLSIGPTGVCAYPGVTDQLRAYMGTAGIKSGEMLWRDQSVFIYKRRSTVGNVLPGRATVLICPHIKFGSMQAFVQYKDQHCGGCECGFCGRKANPAPIRCQNCFTEFRIDFKSFGPRSNGMSVTRWKNLGNGQDPEDYKWKSHLTGSGVSEIVLFERGDIAKAFEGNRYDNFDFTALLGKKAESLYKTWKSKNKKYLKSAI